MIFFHAGVTMVVVWFVMRGNPRVDYRVVAFASLLPDLIDKPIGRVLFRARYNSGRLWAHALLVNVGKNWCRPKDPRCSECPLGPYLLSPPAPPAQRRP